MRNLRQLLSCQELIAVVCIGEHYWRIGGFVRMPKVDPGIVEFNFALYFDIVPFGTRPLSIGIKSFR